jgi:4-amino-4-deoxy-L-arabinose transferase-like glycosyltransferase
MGRMMFDEQFCASRKALILIALFSVPFFINLGANSLWDGNEGFYAEPPREMLQTRNFLVHTYNYEPRFKKPPFATWVIAASYHVFGVSEFSERLPIAIAATLTIFLVYWMGTTTSGASAGLLSALALATMLKFMIYSRQYAGDVFLTLFITAAMASFARALIEAPGSRRLRYELAAYGAVGFGVLDKGLVAIVIPFAVLGLFILMLRRWHLLRLLLSPSGFLLLFFIGAPWYLIMIRRYGWEFFQVNIIQETVMRYVSDQLGGRAYHYYIGVYFAETLPWSLFIIPALVYWGSWVWRELRRMQQTELKTSLPLLQLIWFLFVFFFFSLSVGKRAVYLLALYPAAALVIGHYFTARLFDWKPLLGRLHRVIAILLIVLCFAGAVIAFVAHGKLEVHTKLIYLPIAAVLSLGFGLIWTLRRDALAEQARVISFAGLALIFSLTLLLPKIEYYRPIPRFARLIKEQAKVDDEVGTFFVDAPSLMFYTEQKIFQISKVEELLQKFEQLEGDHRIYFITREDYLKTLQERAPIELEVIDSQPLLQLRWENFFGRSRGPTLRLVLVRMGGGKEKAEGKKDRSML